MASEWEGTAVRGQSEERNDDLACARAGRRSGSSAATPGTVCGAQLWHVDRTALDCIATANVRHSDPGAESMARDAWRTTSPATRGSTRTEEQRRQDFSRRVAYRVPVNEDGGDGDMGLPDRRLEPDAV